MQKRLSLLLLLFAVSSTPAYALITGGKDEPMNDPGWPTGSAELANLKTRVAWWEGPPFGGGQYHFEYSGKTPELQQAIDLFAKIKSKHKRIVVQQSSQPSFWLNVGNRGDKKRLIDWQFVVWIPGNWQHLNDAGRGLLPPGEGGESPKTVLNIFLSDRIDWSTLQIPETLEIEDQRLEANGIAADEGGAIRGTVVDLNNRPISGATVTLGDGTAGNATTDANGDFLITKIPETTHRMVVAAQGYASRDASQFSVTKTTYREMHVRLAKAARVTVRVVDTENQPLQQIAIRIANSQDQHGQHYPLGGKQKFKSDASGEFVLDDVPVGKLKFMSSTREYYHNPVLNEYGTDKTIVLKMQRTGSLLVAVRTTEGEPVTSKYIVNIEEEGKDRRQGSSVGTWGGSGNIRDDGTIIFHNIPPGRYVITGRPNPGRVNDTTDPITVEIKGKDRYSIEVLAK